MKRTVDNDWLNILSVTNIRYWLNHAKFFLQFFQYTIKAPPMRDGTPRMSSQFCKLGSEWRECAGLGMHDIAADGDISWHQGVILHQVDGLYDGILGIFETMKPAEQVDATVLHQRDVLFRHTALAHKVEHLGSIHTLDPTSGMAYNHYLVAT